MKDALTFYTYRAKVEESRRERDVNWWQRLLEKKKLERQLDAELQFHFEQQVADNLRAGMDTREAQRNARLKFGGLEDTKEQCRDARGTRWAEVLIQDVRFALRILRRSPGFTAVAIVSLALGIGANTAIFSVMDALLLRALPVKDPGQLVVFGEALGSGVTDDFGRADLFSQPFYQWLRAKNAVFSDVAALESMSAEVNARFGGAASNLEPVNAQLVSANYFEVLGVHALAGRVLTSRDDRGPGASPVAVLRYGYWQRRFARDRSVIGRSLSFNRSVLTIVGIAAPEFFGTEVGRPPDLWIPLDMQSQAQPWLDHPLGAETQSLWLIGRLKPALTLKQAQANTDVRFRQWLRELAGSHPDAERTKDMRKAHIELTDGSRGISRLRREFSFPLRILMVLVGLVLLIACVNIANLLLAKSDAREREIATRLALGAQRRRLISQLLCESLLLSLMDGGLALFMAKAGSQLLLSLAARRPNPVPLQVGLSFDVLLFAFAVSLSTGLIFGIVPALQMTKVEAGPALKESRVLGRSRFQRRLRRILVAGQVALAFFLIMGAELFITTLDRLEDAGTGFDKERVLLLQLDGDLAQAKGPALMNLYRRLETRVQSLPGVQAASFSMLNFSEGQWTAPAWPKGSAAHDQTDRKSFAGNRVGLEYFNALGTPVLWGRGFGPQDTPKSPSVAVVNETFAHSLFPHSSPLGRRFALSSDNDTYEIVGVVKDAKYQSIREKPQGMFFFYNGQAQDSGGFNDLVVRARRNPESLLAEIRKAMQAESPDLAISTAMTLAQEVDRSLSQEKLMAKLASFFGLLGLLLAATGLYGVIAYSVARRTNEIGIRMALGARPSSIVTQVLRESLIMVVAGLAIGLPAALAGARLIASQLYDVKPSDPVLMTTAAVLLLATALGASIVPARRAALLDPSIALREE